MGLDAVLICVVPGAVEESHLASAPFPCKAVEYISQFGPGRFCARPGNTLIETQAGWRFYGPGYPRGPWDEIVRMIHWMREAFPAGTIYYAGDNWFLREFWVMPPEKEQEITDYFFEEGNEAYYEAFAKAGITVSPETMERIARRRGPER